MSRISLCLLSAAFLLFTSAVATAQKQYLGHWVYDGKLNESHLLEFAENGHVPAITDAGRRYLHGDGVEQDTGTAWYWLKRAQQAGVDISSITPKSLNQLLTEMSKRERYSLTYFANYHEGLNLGGIEIPPLFRPLTPEVPKPLSDREIAAFVEKFKGLNRKDHNQAYMDVEIELGMRASGIRFIGNISIDGQLKPLGMSDEEFVRRKCNFHLAIAKIRPHQRELAGEKLDWKDDALIYLYPKLLPSRFSKGIVGYVRDVLQTDQFCPNPVSQGVSEALAWAKELEKMDLGDLRALADEHLKISGSTRPDLYKPDQTFKTPEQKFELFAHYKLSKTIRKLIEYLHPPPKDDRAYRSELIYLAANNNLGAQLDVAQRLETGEKFRQDNAMAYFWYQRALENGGGKAAQSGMDRLLPHLTKADFDVIEIWVRNKLRPY